MAWYSTFPGVALACIADRLEGVKRNRGCAVTGVGEAVMVTVDVPATDRFAFEVAVTVYVPAVVV
jgi:hypothetical protein